ncbi:MAG: hypothetical protein KJ915_01370 [Candidatus Omnitrophica bacterium]|nr:hypothetical protein [Candidatus Omnitrophota bacterium]
MDKIKISKNQIFKILNQMAAKRFSTQEKIGLIIILITCILIGNYFFNNWIISLKNKNNVVIALTPAFKPKLPAPLFVKKTNDELIIIEPEIKRIRDPFLSSKHPEEVKAIAIKKATVDLKVSGILWDDKIPSAIINSNIVKIGDIVEGKTVVDIERNQVIVMEDGKILVIELRK